MRTKWIVLALAVLLLLGGCAMTPRQRLYSGWQSYKAVAVLLMNARESGMIESDTLWEQILKVDVVVYGRLVAYKHAVEMGLPGEAEWEAFNVALDKLLELYQRIPEPTDRPLPVTPTPMEVLTWQRKRSSWQPWPSGKAPGPSKPLRTLSRHSLA